MVVARVLADSFSGGEFKFLQSLSEHVALAGHQAQLYDDVQRAYNELRATQRGVMQQERLSALGQMASGVAHDINNALSPVSGFAELILATESQLSDSARKYLEHIRTASDDIAHIVSRLREFYRTRLEEQELLPIDVAPLVQQVVDLTRPRWKDLAHRRGHNFEVRIDLSAEVSTFVGIETEVREALTNLVFNAIDAMPEGGTITIRSRPANRLPAVSQKASHLLLEVTDTGIGMDEETRKRCVEPFFSTKGKRGTGLGLAMVYGTLQRHEGTIEVESELGIGTTIRLVFPLRESTVNASANDALARVELPPLRILFVDDEPLLRELVREILETEGHTVITAEGGPAGLQTFRQMLMAGRPPDVLLTDLGMPHLDGRELTHIVKRESPATPVIMITGWGKMLQGEDEIRAPVDALLSKPPKIAELLDALHRVVACNGVVSSR
jgi:signal transduction histidine kinase/ActR/RegA family two-component response regulator